MENCKDLKIVLGGEDIHLNQEEKCIKYCQNQNQTDVLQLSGELTTCVGFSNKHI